ncbi:uncharacterized protein LOC130636322 [Hydractinia symbiolongicarpus]|uniref:uncharacterized protein LOC130636322 n=1 Tax=Hydractinia symbiolongicarpus TaxID=13093 RepID=UPI002549CAB6|nr:uncharacterized protein LOC130636322 [Hydractinia symbiolongicarpus]
MARKVFLWSASRCISTAFERSMMEIQNTHFLHEPYTASYYYGPERQSSRYVSTPVDPNVSYQERFQLLTKNYEGMQAVFSKNLAYTIENHFEELLRTELREFQHTFLIRNPRKSVISLYRVSLDPLFLNWDFFDPVEAGFKQLYDLYQFIKIHLDQQPVVIDADDLLVNPAGTMKAYCKATNLPFSEDMLQWEPGLIPTCPFSVWHSKMAKSAGFIKQTAEQLENFENLDDFPIEVQTCVKESESYYELLKKQKTLPINVN